MKVRGIAIVVILCVAAMTLYALRPRKAGAEAVAVQRDAMWVWSIYDGTLDARHVDVIMSKFLGRATIVGLAEEGTLVEEGDLLVRFDDSQVARELVRLERDAALAGAELRSLLKAKLPMELRDLELRLLDAKADLAAEIRYLDDSRELLQEELVSEQEVVQQELKVTRMESSVEQLGRQLALTTEYLHPAARERAEANLSAAEQELKLAHEQLTNCVVRAPTSGTVVYRLVHVGTEYRTVQVGDAIQRNQPFMALPDMRDIVVRCLVPESELSRVTAGAKVFVAPLAYPSLSLKGRVEIVGSMAQTIPGEPSWKKYFAVMIGLTDKNDCLRPGMSVEARILTYHNADAVVVPRKAVWWDDGKAYCRVNTWDGGEVRRIETGRANYSSYEVLSGLEPGENVLMP